MIDINYFAKKALEAKPDPAASVKERRTAGDRPSPALAAVARNQKPPASGRKAAVRIDTHEGPALGGIDLELTFRGIVYPRHLDHMGHMNVQHYVGMFDQATWVLLAMIGLDSNYFQSNGRGMAALEQSIQYASELRSGDMFDIRSAIVEVREKTIRVLHNMYKAGSGVLAASTTILGVHIDTSARKSLPLPESFRERARVMVGTAC